MIQIVIADDQELILESLSIVLDMEDDIKVVGLAKDGEEAVRYCEREQPDVVLMDIHMPNQDGVQATKAIKAKFPSVKIIMLTSYKEVDYVMAALAGGAEGYLLKAINPKNLIAGIRVVHAGGTLISQEMASDFIRQLSMPKTAGQSEEGQGSHDRDSTGEGRARSKSFGSVLSDREIAVLKKLALGLRNQEIAEALFLSEGTVKNYISNIYSKLNVKGRLEATQKARDAGILKKSHESAL